ncbi:MAG: DUF1553 domain-containing protein [Candidatus Hydrogenedentes bacterium]|nr:DUF1553 domain-containing protein [Candidatus Hydrogenedentota bacterium]
MLTTRSMVRLGRIAVALVATVAASRMAVRAEGTVQFSRDVVPILSVNCYPCHGPDANTRKRDIRFDTKEGLFGKTKDGLDLIVPGNPDSSEIMKRLGHPDLAEVMPPPESKLHVSERELGIVKMWISQGAVWQGHWAFITPQKPALPKVSNEAWCRNEIDRFILERIERAGLTPAEEADKETLLRRVSLDLTGLPPSPAEVDAFLADTSDSAYEKVVDRLLASPHYGERMSFIWLDVSRYADTNGYQRDTKRIMWPWRDWVIKAYNDNMPFDQFATEQLAGDLLPDATLEQRIATGFNRNHRINGEGGIIPEEYAVEYVADRVVTTSTAFMGLSMVCARCHDHKFDPFSMREFYQLYAFFSNVPEEGKGREQGNDKPFVEVPTPEQAAKKTSLTASLAALEDQLSGPDTRLDSLQSTWEEELGRKFAELDWQAVDIANAVSQSGAELAPQQDKSFLAGGAVAEKDVYTITFVATRPIGAIKLDVLTDPSLPQNGPGRGEDGNVVLSGFEVGRSSADSPDKIEPVRVSAAFADYAQTGGDYSVRNAIDADPATGWATGSPQQREDRVAVFVLEDATAIKPGDRVTVTLRHESPHAGHSIGKFRLSQSPSQAIVRWTQQELGPWHFVGPLKADVPTNTLLETAFPPEEGYDPARTYGDGSLRWTERPDWTDGQVNRFDTRDPSVHYLHRTIKVDVSTAITFALGSNDAIKVWVDGQVRLANNVGRIAAPDQEKLTLFLEEGTHDVLLKIANYGGETGYYFRLVPDDGQGVLAMMDLLATPTEERNAEDQRRLTTLFRERDEVWRAKRAEAAGVRSQLDVLNKSIITTMVMEEMETPREVYKLARGVYDKPDKSERLYPGVPASLGAMDESLPKNRLGFAKWLVDPKHPLTARVRVNHYWQMYFGHGIVKTSEDFGTQGTLPTHPELLDWLAVTFVDSGWDVKAMQKRIVMSATYRQSSKTTQEKQEKDPVNVLLSHAPRTRLPAEIIRDQALAVSGLLNPEIGGPPVKPYQPADLWSALTFQNMDEYDTNFYVQDTGGKLYRRGLYTYWKRTILPPHMQIFNAAGREMCSMRQENTNTPMQALAIMNDPTFVEAARFLGQRMILEGGERSGDRVRFGFRLLMAHAPNAKKEQVLLAALNDYQSHFIHDQESAAKLLEVGDSKPSVGIPAPELAAYTMLASVMLNMDEAITRE